MDEVLSRYLCRSSFARLAPETKRNYTDDYCLFFDFLWGRGKNWSGATADDLWDFEDWRTRSLRNPRRVGGARWNRGLTALAWLYEWAVRHEHVRTSPVVMRSVPGRNGGSIQVPAASSKNARASEVRWLTPRAFRRWVEVGLRGFGDDGAPSPRWAGRMADRNGAFADLLFLFWGASDGRGVVADGGGSAASAGGRPVLRGAAGPSSDEVAAGSDVLCLLGGRWRDRGLHRVLACPCGAAGAGGGPLRRSAGTAGDARERAAPADAALARSRRRGRANSVVGSDGRGDDGAGVCGPCVGFAADYTCKECGRTGNPHSRGRCAHCVLAERVNALLAGPDGTITSQLEPLAAALANAPSPFPAIQWIKESPNTKLLARLASEGHELSHELLDELPPSRNQRYIRQLLVHTRVLEERNEDLERIPGWLEHELADKPAAHASLARPFLHWFLLRRARQRAATRRHPASADRDLRHRVSVALDFLAWIDQRGLALADLAQEHIDDWIAGAPSQRRYLIRYFLKWTTSRRLTRELTVPSIPSQEPQDLLVDDDRWRLLQRCLTDDALPTDVRAGGGITLLFGLSTERLCHLTPERLKFGDKHTHLVLGRHPVLLPPRLAELLRHLAEQPRLRPQLSRAHPGPQWLFPGMVPGKPISTHGMTQKLNRHGIPVRTARNGALAALAADLPSPILADVTGMHCHTALRWVAYARRDWAEYLAARADDLKDEQ